VQSENRRKAVLYARVSTAEQEREGFSIPAQLKLLREYAALNDIDIAGEHVDVETARKTGRTQFDAMLAYLKRHTTVEATLVEKTDRLYRNLKDWVTLDELGVEIHLAKEGVVLSKDSRSSEKFMHGIKVLMAKNYIDNLSEEARKGMNEKAAQGYWPSLAPLGYRNVRNDDGKKVIVVDPDMGPRVARLFEHASTGDFSLNELAAKGRDLGIRYRRSGKPIGTSTLQYLLRNRLYSGSYEWNGRIYQGRHEPIITPELWEAVQDVVDGRAAANVRANPKDFVYSVLMTCGHCGCAIVAEIKKQKYIYYHCTGYKRKCPERYVRQEVLDDHFERLLKRLHLDTQVFELLRSALKESHADERVEREEARERLSDEADQLQRRLDMIYLDRVEGRITADYHDRIVVPRREERARVIRNLEHLNSVDEAYVDDSVALLELVTNAHKGFASTPPKHKRRALNLVLSNCTWANDSLTAIFRQPFDMLRDFTSLTPDREISNPAASAGFPDLVILSVHISNFFKLPSVESKKIVERYRAAFKDAA
jgi:DNA invertase Pin-like site-specific DNA recombinase